MEILVSNKKERINPYNMRFSKRLKEGSQMKPYIINGKVYKLYKEHLINEKLISMNSHKPTILTKEKVDIMKRIPTKRIILPRESILNKKRKLVGYITEYIENLGINNFANLERNKLIDELKILKEDLYLLEENGILIDDLILENTSFNNGLYLIDPGAYKTNNETKLDSLITGTYNIERFNEYMTDRVLFSIAKSIDEADTIKLKKQIKSESSNDYSVLDYLINSVKEENLSEFIKTKVK